MKTLKFNKKVLFVSVIAIALLCLAYVSGNYKSSVKRVINSSEKYPVTAITACMDKTEKEMKKEMPFAKLQELQFTGKDEKGPDRLVIKTVFTTEGNHEKYHEDTFEAGRHEGYAFVYKKVLFFWVLESQGYC